MGSKLIVWVAALCLLPLAGCNCRSIDTHEDTDDTDQVDLDHDGHLAIDDGGDDCDDDNPLVHPGALEICDGADNDCDEEVDEDALDATTWYDDDDEDGFGDPEDAVKSCGAPAGFVDDATDCDDTDAEVYPGADEVVGDGIDQDCDTDELCYGDQDLDGFSGSGTVESADLDCEDPGEGYLVRDCDDEDPRTYPGAAILDSEHECMTDADEDGFGDPEPGWGIEPGTDCDDGDPDAYPEALEVVADGVDQNCDGDEDCWKDGDGDGFGDDSGVIVASADLDCEDAGESWTTGDCNDGDGSAYPGAHEVVGDGIDQDCDSIELCYTDSDGDGVGTPWILESTDDDCADLGESSAYDDCDDEDAEVYPGATEEPADGRDGNCDGAEDCYADDDDDGFGDDSGETTSSSDLLCDDVNEAWSTGDCNDEDPAAYPDADEVVGDGIDQDCDGYEDCYTDGDGDGYGAGEAVTVADLDCDDAGESAYPGDCNDEDDDAYPGADEIPADGTDQDCDGYEACFADADADGFGDPESTVDSIDLDCDDPGESVYPDDCLDTDDEV